MTTVKRFRTTISLNPETHEIFKRMAEAANMSVSKCMGDWLDDTADAAQMITLKMEEAKRAPMRVMREMRALVAGMSDEMDETMDEIRGRKRVQAPGGEPEATQPGPVGASGADSPPSSNTGGNSPTATKRTGGKK